MNMLLSILEAIRYYLFQFLLKHNPEEFVHENYRMFFGMLFFPLLGSFWMIVGYFIYINHIPVTALKRFPWFLIAAIITHAPLYFFAQWADRRLMTSSLVKHDSELYRKGRFYTRILLIGSSILMASIGPVLG